MRLLTVVFIVSNDHRQLCTELIHVFYTHRQMSCNPYVANRISFDYSPVIPAHNVRFGSCLLSLF